MRQPRGDFATAALLSLGPAAALGLARFGYALLLPAMRVELGWNFTTAGSMNTANALGYLAGALVAAPLARSMGSRRAFVGSMLVTALALVMTGLTTGVPALLVLRTLAGLAGAVVFITGASLAAHLASHNRRAGLIVGLYFGGVGIGILVTGLGLPLLLERDPGIWRRAWIGMGLASFAASLWAGRAVRALPKPPGRSEAAGRVRPLRLAPSLAAYFLFGLGYITYMTFVVAFLQRRGGGAAEVSIFWAALGLATLGSAIIWSRALDRLRSGVALAAVLAVVAAGVLLPLVSTSPVAMLASGMLFGSSFLSVVAAVTTVVRRVLPAHAWAGGIALFTVVFSVGQTLGPVAAGLLADLGPGLSAGLGMSAGVLALGALVSLLQKEGSP